MQEVKIFKDRAIEAYKSKCTLMEALALLFGKEVLCQDPMEWVTSFADICTAAGENVNDYSFPSDPTCYKQIRDICVSKIELIEKVLNNGWVQDIADTTQRKYYPIFNIIADKSMPGGFRLSFLGSVFACGYSHFGVRPAYRDSKVSDFAGRTFLPEYQELAQAQKIFLINK